MPVGLLRLARPRRAALALPRSAAVAAGRDRADRAGRPVSAPRLHAREVRSRLPALPQARDAVRHPAARARLGDRPGLPRDRRDAAARAGVRARGLPRAAVRLVHDAARVRRAARADRGARGHRRLRRRGDRRAARRPRRRGGLPGRPRRGPHRRGLAHARAGQGRPVGRPRALHGPVADLRGRRPAPRGRRLPARRGLRRPARQPRPDARAHAAARGPARDPAGAALRARHAGGRRRDGRQQRVARPGGRRGRA